MRALVVSGLLLCFVGVPASGEELIASITFSDLQHADSSGGGLVKAFKDGDDAGIVITYDGTDERSFMLAGIYSNDLEMTRVAFRAVMSSEDLLKPAWLEMRAVVSGQPVYPRGADAEMTGTQPPRVVEVPIMLGKGDVLERVRLGVHFEGPGTVTLRKMELWDLGPEGILDGPMRGIAGIIAVGVFALTCGLWSLIWYVFSSRDAGHIVVLNTTGVLASLSGATLMLGTVVWTQNLAWLPWQPLVLLGTVGAALFGIGYILLQWRYGVLEAGDTPDAGFREPRDDLP